MRIINKTKNFVLASDATEAKSLLGRMKGLLGKKGFQKGEGLVIPACKCIHMFFMKFPIDVIFLSKDNRVVGIIKKIKPFRMSPYFSSAQKAVELPAGIIEESETMMGDDIIFQEGGL